MSEAKTKSRTFRRLKTRTPSGNLVTHYARRKPSKAHCAECGDVLKGVTRGNPSTVFNTPKSQRRPERPYGGVLCSRCSRKLIVSKVRSIFSLSKK